MDFAYVAHTEACTFLLDAEGVCRWFMAKEGATEATLRAAERCVGAQYVASLDAEAEGLLTKLPKPGTRLLFACVGEGGRVSLVRSGPVLKFEAVDAPATTPDAVAAEATAPPVPPAPPPAPTDRASAPEALPSTVAVPEQADLPAVEALPAAEKDDDDCETAPFSSARPTFRGRSADDTEPPTTKRAPQTIRAFPAPPVLRADAAARRGMLPRRAVP
jgi:hypothetical protein